jgi:hypothetical protein
MDGISENHRNDTFEARVRKDMIDRDRGLRLSSVILLALDSEHADGAFCNGMRMSPPAHLRKKRGHLAGVG